MIVSSTAVSRVIVSSTAVWNSIDVACVYVSYIWNVKLQKWKCRLERTLLRICYQVFIDWAKKPSKKYVSKEVSSEILAKAAPFIQWLSQAEEESSEEEEEDDLEVDFSRTGKVGTEVIKVEKPVATKKEDAVDDDEFIDDI